jgi:hypothetical protein
VKGFSCWASTSILIFFDILLYTYFYSYSFVFLILRRYI